MGRAVEQLQAVGRPAGEGFQIVLRFQHIADLLLVSIVEYEVRAVVHHLNLVVVNHVEGLSRLVGGEYHPVARGVPRGVDGVRQHGVAFHVHLLCFSVLHEHGAAVLGADVEEHVLGAVVLVVVAVDAVVFVVAVLPVVLIDGLHVEVLQVALVKSELAVEFVGGFDETVGEVAVDGLLGHGESVGGELHPASVAQGVEGDGEVAAFGGLEQAAPLQGVKAEFAVAARCRQDLTAAAFHAAHKFRTFGLHLDVERGDVGRYDNVAVVRVDACRLLYRCALFGDAGFRSGAGCKENGQQERRKEK